MNDAGAGDTGAGNTGAGNDGKDARGADAACTAAEVPCGPSPVEFGGDPACWLNRVCDACGRFVENEFADDCPYCGAARALQGGS